MKQKTALIILVMYSVLIFIASSLPGSVTIPEKGFITISSATKHFVEFFIFGVLSMNFFYNYPKVKASGEGLTYACVLGLSYSALDEFHQYFVPTRVCSLEDIMINIIGSIVGIIAFSSFKYFRVKKR